ncbi:MAG: hypothetical protein U5O16_38165 [Rhodococcus sp. (in: high G+C Gram-positive bacteria)]|uniref:hypothetical protein n=1 Tax=Rhodococcus sp. TaxID=1831 RepID=UPI002ADC9968|nr:hypothetical protein [Rhodococcus sp. (in: high G+C Gram-positive bacteria)]
MATSAAPHIDDTHTPDSTEELAAAQLDSVRRALQVTPEQDAFLAGAAAALRTARHME